MFKATIKTQRHHEPYSAVFIVNFKNLFHTLSMYLSADIIISAVRKKFFCCVKELKYIIF